MAQQWKLLLCLSILPSLGNCARLKLHALAKTKASEVDRSGRYICCCMKDSSCVNPEGVVDTLKVSILSNGTTHCCKPQSYWFFSTCGKAYKTPIEKLSNMHDSSTCQALEVAPQETHVAKPEPALQPIPEAIPVVEERNTTADYYFIDDAEGIVDVDHDTVLFSIAGCGEERANGEWKLTGWHRKRPVYRRTTDKDAIIMWSEGREVWRLIIDNAFGWDRPTLYQTKSKDRQIPLSGWEVVQGKGNSPTLTPRAIRCDDTIRSSKCCSYENKCIMPLGECFEDFCPSGFLAKAPYLRPSACESTVCSVSECCVATTTTTTTITTTSTITTTITTTTTTTTTYCMDIDNGNLDSGGDSCTYYTSDPWECSRYDHQGFTAAHVCCACGGGDRKKP